LNPPLRDGENVNKFLGAIMPWAQSQVTVCIMTNKSALLSIITNNAYNQYCMPVEDIINYTICEFESRMFLLTRLNRR